MNRAVFEEPEALIGVEGTGVGDCRAAGEDHADRVGRRLLAEAEVEEEGILASLASAALHVAEQGFHVLLVERDPELGGLLNRGNTVLHDDTGYPAIEIVAGTRERVERHPSIEVRTGTELATVEGYIGNYAVTLRPAGEPEGPTEAHEISTIDPLSPRASSP